MHGAHGGISVREGGGVPDDDGPHRAADVLGDPALVRQDPRPGAAADAGLQPAVSLSLLPGAQAAYPGMFLIAQSVSIRIIGENTTFISSILHLHNGECRGLDNEAVN